MGYRPEYIPVRHAAEFRQAEVIRGKIRQQITQLSDLLHEIAVKEENRYKQATALLVIGNVMQEVYNVIDEARRGIGYINEDGIEIQSYGGRPRSTKLVRSSDV